MPDAADVAIVGAGPAGTSLAIRLAARGISSIIVERTAEPRWRACGVFSSPLSRGHLVELGLPEGALRTLLRPISALDLETVRGTACRITYEHGQACGFDRPGLDRALLDRARAAGVDVRAASVPTALDLPRSRGQDALLTIAPTAAGHGEARQISARIVVGAGGAGFVLPTARALQQPTARRIWKSGITFHRPDGGACADSSPAAGRFVFGDGWYVGVAPVPGGRVNVGAVVPGPWLHDRSAEAISQHLFDAFPGPRAAWMDAPNSDGYRVAGVLNHGARNLGGDGWLLVGDATGFIDPLTGDGLHRALVSTRMAAEAIDDYLAGKRTALTVYDRHIRSRFNGKDVVSWVLQGFLARPRLFEYALRRLARRSTQRRVLTLVLTDQLPASRTFDPRFLARLLAP